MASSSSSSSLLSEEQLLCPICLEVFAQPVSTPCGHNYCMSCITAYWSDTAVCQCPVCKETFTRRPNMKVNTFISELASQFMSLKATDAHVSSSERLESSGGGETLCDICTGTRLAAVKSCLECLTSYCSAHLEPHHRVAGLRRHTLVEPSLNLEDKICKEHNKLLVQFCRTDKVLMCDACATSHQHVNHSIIPLQQACTEMKAWLGEAEARAQQMIQEKQKKVQAVTESVQERQKQTEDAIADSVKDLTALISEIWKKHTELVKSMREKQKAAKEEADGFVSNMEQEIAALQATAEELKELKHTEDQVTFLQRFPHHQRLLLQTAELSTSSLETRVTQKSFRKPVFELETLLSKINRVMTELADGGTEVSHNATLRYMQQYEQNILLDPGTTHPRLIVSLDRKQVRFNSDARRGINSVTNPNMFTCHFAVLGHRGFSQKFYFEVFVGKKMEWNLGVATASIERKQQLQRNSESGLWALRFKQDRFENFNNPNVLVYRGKVERVGVFVDYHRGQVSFYDVEATSLIYSFTECLFTEKLFPYFNPCDNELGSNLDPMVIVPVGKE